MGKKNPPNNNAVAEVNTKIYYKSGSSPEQGSNNPSSPPHHQQCFICANLHPKYWAITECNHQVCWLCILRLRTLYEVMSCPMCKTPKPRALIVRGKTAGGGSLEQIGFEELWQPSMPKIEAFQLWLEDEALRREVQELLKLNCPVSKCKSGGFDSKILLKRHVSSIHNLLLCDICLAHKRVFAHEMVLFSHAALERHQKNGDGAGSKGHPPCNLCGTLFYSDDELQQHIREKHERCHICSRSNPSSQQHIFRDYGSLAEHFGRAHYYCPERVCLDLKFVVFETEIEYKAHLAEMHMGRDSNTGAGRMQRSAQNQLRRVDPSFVFETVSSANRSAAARPSQPPPPAPIIPPSIAVAPVVGEDILFNGSQDSMSALLGRLESLTIYEESNREVLRHLQNQLSNADIAQVRQICSAYQKDQIGIVEMFTRLTRLFGSAETIKQVFERLITLQLDPRKRSEMTAQLTGHLNRLAAFPSLPEGEDAPVVLVTKQPARPNAGNKVLRIGPKPAHPHSVFVSRTGPLMGSDPTKNPLRLVQGTGTLTSATLTANRFKSPSLSSERPVKVKEPSQKPVKASFDQALKVGPASCAPIDHTSGNRHQSGHYALDDQQYPTLGGKIDDGSVTTSIGAAQVKSNIFSRAFDHTGPETFVMGGGESSHDIEDESADSEIKAVKKKRSKKGRVVLQCAHPTL